MVVTGVYLLYETSNNDKLNVNSYLYCPKQRAACQNVKLFECQTISQKIEKKFTLRLKRLVAFYFNRKITFTFLCANSASEDKLSSNK